MPRILEKTTIAPPSPGPTVSVAAQSLDPVTESAYLLRLWGKNEGAAPFYIHFLDAIALPGPDPIAVDHKIPPVEVAAGFEFALDFLDVPIAFRTGIVIYASSSQILKNLIAGSDMVATMQYTERL